MEHPWSLSVREVLERVEVDPDRGVPAPEVEPRRHRYGANRLKKHRTKSVWAILWEQLANVIVALLAVAGIVAFSFGQVLEGVTIVIVLVVNTGIGFVAELTAVRSMEALSRLGKGQARVLRDGDMRTVRADRLVVGDIVLLEAGDVVPSDCRLLDATNLQTNESALTGESTAVSKSPRQLDKDTRLPERGDMVYKGTAVTSGSGRGVVVATGMRTELGQVASMVEEQPQKETGLERQLDKLGYRLLWLTLAIAAAVGLTGIAAGRPLLLMVETAIALAVAAIPEGLPIVSTTALARGMWRMSKRNALINRLPAVETLGAVNRVCSDKTGTLTENRMKVTRMTVASDGRKQRTVAVDPEAQRDAFSEDDRSLHVDGEPVLHQALLIGQLCTSASLGDGENGKEKGDPLEIALLRVARQAGMTRGDLLRKLPEVRREAFSRDTKMMATMHRENGRVLYAVKGAPEAVLRSCTHVGWGDGRTELDDGGRERWRERNEELASQGLRLLALACKETKGPDEPPYESLSLIGLVGMIDPPRRDVEDQLQACADAGIGIIVATGDQAGTARAVAAQLGLVDPSDPGAVLTADAFERLPQDPSLRERILQCHLFARITPRQKLTLIDLHQDAGNVVAMTGDGINDAPALRKANIGIAMGQRGTQVAKEAADMVLKDDRFASIVAAVKQGRTIFANIRRFVIYLLSGNVSEVLVVAAALLTGLPLPILPLQILYLNMISDVLPALALGVGPDDERAMHRPPRSTEEPLIGKRHWGVIGLYGVMIAVIVYAAFFIALRRPGFSGEEAVTVSFLTLTIGRLVHAFNMREIDSRLLRNNVVRNGWLWLALGVGIVLLLIAVYVRPLGRALGIVTPTTEQWLMAVAGGMVPLLIGQVAIGTLGLLQRRRA
ncbi:MAG: HAD-IC family P-type ATPase [Chitinivibrionales bacterium]|nr:HAD-IC family P-type ATPase [Chitinivibrionales bacterium]